MRKCDGCTKCCEGWLHGSAHGKSFWPGRPCHFVGERSCTIYNKRPEDPCRIFSCEWLKNPEIPEWMKPDRDNLLIVDKKIKGVKFWKVLEAGQKIRVESLSWLINYALSTGINLEYAIGTGLYRIGSKDFLIACGDIEPFED